MTLPSTGAITTIGGKRRGSSWMAGHTLYPYPVYEARFVDGTVARLSFWQETNKPWDFARPRAMLARIYGKPVAVGFVEHDVPNQRWMRIADPMAEVDIKPKRGPTAAQLKKLLANVLEGDGAAIEQARELLAA